MDWYQTNNWNENSKIEFESRLKKSRGSYNKAQYLRIKGSTLISCEELWKQEAGISLLKRVVNDYPNEKFHTFFAYEELGDYFRLNNELEKAILNYKKVLEYYKEDRNGTSGIADIKYAEVNFESNKREEYSNLVELLTVTFKETKGHLTFKDEIFRYNLVLAKIYNVIGDKNLAIDHAKVADKIYESKQVQFPKYPKLGLIQVSDFDLLFLKGLSV